MQNALEITNLTVSYGATPALNRVNLIVEEGEFLGIMGPNGGGKSTLLKAVLGIIPINQGKITIMGEDKPMGRQNIGYVPQFSNMDRTFPVTVLDIVLSGMLGGGLHPFYRFKKQQRELALSFLAKVNLEHLSKRQINDLSGGEFQRLLIARA
ncbi:MAG: ATP-binding cassette domain-containing protein, partial [Oscillospiraceae bacterium]